MKDETIDDKIRRLKNELEKALQEKKNIGLKNQNLINAGETVYVVGEIVEVDPNDPETPYHIEFNDGANSLWIDVGDVKEIKS